MDNSQKAECAVCADITGLRCPACTVHFCSMGHQKLVWPVHKLVCGPGKAHPFTLPRLTDDEIKTLAVTLESSCCDKDVEEVSPDWAELGLGSDLQTFVETVLLLPKGTLKESLPDIRSFVKRYTKEGQSSFYKMIRYATWLSSLTARKMKQPFPDISPFCLCTYLEMYKEHLFPGTSEEDVSMILHHGLILLAAAQTVRADNGPSVNGSSPIGVHSLSKAWEAWFRRLYYYARGSKEIKRTDLLWTCLDPLRDVFPNHDFQIGFSTNWVAGMDAPRESVDLWYKQKLH